MVYTIEVKVHVSAKDATGVEHAVDFGLSPDMLFDAVSEAAHRNADGSVPHPKDIGVDLWEAALTYRRVQAKLATLCGETPSEVFTAARTGRHLALV